MKIRTSSSGNTYKKANFDDFTDRKIAMIQKKINRRPRQKLNFQTPKYEFYKRIL